MNELDYKSNILICYSWSLSLSLSCNYRSTPLLPQKCSKAPQLVIGYIKNLKNMLPLLRNWLTVNDYRKLSGRCLYSWYIFVQLAHNVFEAGLKRFMHEPAYVLE